MYNCFVVFFLSCYYQVNHSLAINIDEMWMNSAIEIGIGAKFL